MSRKNKKQRKHAAMPRRSPNADIQRRYEQLIKSREPLDAANNMKVLLTDWTKRLMSQYITAFQRKYRIETENVDSITMLDIPDISSKEFIPHSWLQLIPCFEEGSLTIPADEDDDEHYYWRLLDIDYDSKSMTLDIFHNFNDNMYDTMIKCTTLFTGKPDDKTFVFDVHTFSSTRYLDEILGCLNTITECGWNEKDMRMWHCVGPDVGSPKKDEYIIHVIENFLMLIGISNAVMSAENPTPKKRGNRIIDENTAISLEPDDRPAIDSTFSFGQHMDVHTNGSWPTIQARYAAEKSAHVNNIVYTTPQWKTRGHMRTSKNGTPYYVKPYTAHRKLLDIGATVPAKHISITK